MEISYEKCLKNSEQIPYEKCLKKYVWRFQIDYVKFSLIEELTYESDVLFQKNNSVQWCPRLDWKPRLLDVVVWLGHNFKVTLLL
jgi:hypothetical protein